MRHLFLAGRSQPTDTRSVDQWLTGAKAMGNGLAMFTEGKEKGLSSLVNADPSHAQTIPLVRHSVLVDVRSS